MGIKVKLILTILLTLFIIFSLSGCYSKTYTIKELICFKQEKIERLPPTPIRILNEDLELAMQYKLEMNEILDFYEYQVDVNNKVCERIEKEREKE